ncbi:MAG: hypothetical protein WBB67_07090, partial [bacterium]
RMEMIHAPSHFLLRSINSVAVNHPSNNKVRGAGWNGFFEWNDSKYSSAAPFQPMAPFQHVVIPSNPLGFKGSSYLIT